MAKIESHVAADIIQRNSDQEIVNVVAAQVGVAVGSNDFENTVVQFENRDIKGAAAQVIHCDNPVFLFVQPVGEGSRSWLVHQAQNIESCNTAGILGGLPLAIVEICRNRDDGLGHRRGEKSLCVAF